MALATQRQSPLRNRVAPDGRLIATPARGLYFGNRGCLHDRSGALPTDERLHWAGRRWIICLTRYKNWRRPLTPPGGYTALFFLDEATALAAGHRPCALCQRAAYNDFRRRMGAPHISADALDLQLHRERLDGRVRRTHRIAWRDLPVGAMVLQDDGPALALADAIAPWTPAGYAACRSRPTTGNADCLTPPLTLTALRLGYPVKLHPAGEGGDYSTHR